MPNREQWIIRHIEALEQSIVNANEAIGDLKRELMLIKGKTTNQHSLNCAPIYDPFYEKAIAGEYEKR